MFPATRMRRLRRSQTLRRLVRETRLSVDNLVYPLFVCPGRGVRDPIDSMPGNFRMSVDRLVEECREALDLGIPGVILFGIPEAKDATGSTSWASKPLVIVPAVDSASFWLAMTLASNPPCMARQDSPPVVNPVRKAAPKFILVLLLLILRR